MHYAVSVWNPHHQSLIEKLEKVQKRATKLVINIKKITLRRKVTTIEVTHFEIQNLRIRGDMIELYKIFAGKYDNNTTEWITGKYIAKQHDTRNHRFALQQSHVHYDMRKFNFSNRIIHGIVYQIPDFVVASPTQ